MNAVRLFLSPLGSLVLLLNAPGVESVLTPASVLLQSRPPGYLWLAQAERLQKALAQEPRAVARNRPSPFDPVAADALLRTLGRNLKRLFQGLTDVEAFRLCVCVEALEARMRDSKDDGNLQPGAWQAFQRAFPESPLLAQAQWAVVRIAAPPYEYESSAEAALDEVHQYEAFLAAHPGHPCKEAAQLALARALRIAYECFRYAGPGGNPRRERRAGLACRLRAQFLLEGLTASSDSALAAEATRQLKGLRRGKCVYLGPGSDNPQVEDGWGR